MHLAEAASAHPRDRDERDALAAGLGAQGELAQLVQRHAQDLCGRYEIPSAVERTHQGEEFAGRVSEAGNGPGRLVGLLSGSW